jgi:sigma-B regulation protein RsbU (phosphoserine phosphatase)
VTALVQAVQTFAQSRHALNDFSRALATAWKESNFLHDLTQLLHDIVDVQAAAAVIVRQLARVQRHAQVALFLRDAGVLRQVACHPERPLAEGAWADVHAAVAHPEPVVRADAEGCRVALPLSDGEQPIGVLLLQGNEALLHAANVKFLTSVGSQIALALRLRYEVQHRIEAAAIQRDLALGAEIQRSLLPQAAPRFPGVRLGGECRSAQLVGGDGFDYNAHAGGLDVAIADVSGHGIAAGLLMSSFLGMIRSLDLARHTPAELAELANRRICREVGLSGQFITACYARLAPGGRRLTYAALGHPTPLLWRGDTITPLAPVVGLPAGLLEGARFGEAELALEPGDVVLFYTDGLVEACAPGGEPFGVERLASAMAAGPRDPQAILKAVFDACQAFQGGQPPRDDQTAIALHVLDEE